MGESRSLYIEFPVNDIERAKTFFSRVFGWVFVDHGPEYCSFVGSQVNGGFYRSPLCVNPAAGSAMIVFYSSDLEETMEAIEAAGGAITKGVFRFPGGRRFHFRDVNENEFAVWSDE